jgi:hypothetical protein
MSLPVFTSLHVVKLFISAPTPYSSLLARLWSHLVSKQWEASLLVEPFSFGLSLLRRFHGSSVSISLGTSLGSSLSVAGSGHITQSGSVSADLAIGATVSPFSAGFLGPWLSVSSELSVGSSQSAQNLVRLGSSLSVFFISCGSCRFRKQCVREGIR